MNKWFNDVFLPSIFERCGACKSLWLSQKQTAVCVDNMQKRVCAESDGVYTYRHYNFVCEWRGRSVVLSYSKKNGCGSISFGMNEEEQKQAEREREEEKRQLELKDIERAKRNPKIFEREVKELQKEESRLVYDIETISICLEDETDPKWRKHDEERISRFNEKLAECRRLLALYMA